MISARLCSRLFRVNQDSPIRQYVSDGLITETDQETAQLLFSEDFFSIPVERPQRTFKPKTPKLFFFFFYLVKSVSKKPIWPEFTGTVGWISRGRSRSSPWKLHCIKGKSIWLHVFSINLSFTNTQALTKMSLGLFVGIYIYQRRGQ